MTAKVSRSHHKAKTGSIQVRNSNNRLQLIFTQAGKRHFVFLGLSDTPLNVELAQDIAFEVQRDLEYGEFDPTYQKYKPAAEVTESSGKKERGRVRNPIAMTTYPSSVSSSPALTDETTWYML